MAVKKLSYYKKHIANLIITISIVYFIGVSFFKEPLQHYFYSFKNGHEVSNVNSFQLNKDLFSVVSKGQKFSTLKLKGFNAEELNVGLIKPKDKLSDFVSMLDETNIVINNKNCVAATLDSDFFGSYRFIIQHIKSTVTFLFESKLETKLIEKICNSGMVAK